MREPVDSLASEFEEVRGRLFGLAYRMLGSRAEAEDVVQEAYLRWHQSDRESVRNPEAWLVTVATRLAIDRFRALKSERQAYLGPWLPEPLMSTTPPPDRDVELASDLSIAFLVLLERLGPEERAAFLLHDVFDCGFGQIAGMLGKTESACRQIIHRARERVRKEKRRFPATEAAKANLLRRFIAAVEAGDEKALLDLFAPDATWTADGGGKVAALRLPIVGAERIVHLVLHWSQRLYGGTATLHLAAVNGETGLLVRVGGQLTAAMSFASDGERIVAVYAVLNPEKLGSTNQRVCLSQTGNRSVFVKETWGKRPRTPKGTRVHYGSGAVEDD